eukprot:COSAG04_NODE_315_length_17025_cov_118.870318_8_plen_195_part_00
MVVGSFWGTVARTDPVCWIQMICVACVLGIWHSVLAAACSAAALGRCATCRAARRLAYQACVVGSPLAGLRALVDLRLHSVVQRPVRGLALHGAMLPHATMFVDVQPASCLNSSLGGTLAGRVNFAALLLCLVFVVVSHSHAPSAAFQLVPGSCVMRVPTRQSITYSAKDLCSVRSVDCGLGKSSAAIRGGRSS